MARTIAGGWYQGEKGLELRPLDKVNQPVYRVEMAQLPRIKYLHTTYEPVLANTTAVVESGIQQQSREFPEVMSWRLDLWLSPSDGECPLRDGIQFVCFHDRNKESKQELYELDFLGGKKLSAWEAYYVKMIFDKAISMIK